MKAIILTYAPVEEYERKILKETDIFKLAINQHAEEYRPSIRFITDYILAEICQYFPEKVVSVRDKFRYESGRVEYFDTEFKGVTMISAIEYLIYKGFDEILIVGDNTVNEKEFQDAIKRETDILKEKVSIYQYSKGNFNLPIKSISEFISKNL